MLVLSSNLIMCCKFNFWLSELALSQFQSNIVVLVFPVQTFVGLDDVTKLQDVNFLHADSIYFSLFLCFHGTHLDFLCISLHTLLGNAFLNNAVTKPEVFLFVLISLRGSLCKIKCYPPVMLLYFWLTFPGCRWNCWIKLLLRLVSLHHLFCSFHKQTK